MSQKNIIVLVVCVLIGLGIVVYLVRVLATQRTASTGGSGGAATLDLTKSFPVKEGQAFPTDKKITLFTGTATIQVNNFLQNTLAKTTAGEYAFVLRSGSDYAFLFQPDGNFFEITIQREPYEAGRATAERDLLTTLGISKEDACKLPVQVYFGPPGNGNINEQLSFCF